MAIPVTSLTFKNYSSENLDLRALFFLKHQRFVADSDTKKIVKSIRVRNISVFYDLEFCCRILCLNLTINVNDQISQLINHSSDSE